jgi:hypothetical protein
VYSDQSLGCDLEICHAAVSATRVNQGAESGVLHQPLAKEGYMPASTSLRGCECDVSGRVIPSQEAHFLGRQASQLDVWSASRCL